MVGSWTDCFSELLLGLLLAGRVLLLNPREDDDDDDCIPASPVLSINQHLFSLLHLFPLLALIDSLSILFILAGWIALYSKDGFKTQRSFIQYEARVGGHAHDQTQNNYFYYSSYSLPVATAASNCTLFPSHTFPFLFPTTYPALAALAEVVPLSSSCGESRITARRIIAVFCFEATSLRASLYL